MRIVVCGTGTDVGKTHVACALVRHLREKGTGVVGLKPIATGEGRESDAERLGLAAGADPVAPLHSFTPPISPHLAARAVGVRIEAEAITRWVNERSAGAACVVETAGGLFSPLSDELHHGDTPHPGLNNAALIRALGPDAIVLVAPNRLGVLHDVSAALLAWRAESRQRLVVALSGAAKPDASSTSNAAELVRLGLAAAVVAFPRAAETAPETQQAAAALSASLARGSS